MKIHAKQAILENEIDNLHQDIESLDEQLVNLKTELNEKKDAFYKTINNTYSNNIITKSIDDFYSLLNGYYSNKFNNPLAENEGNFKKEFYQKIQYTSVEGIIKSMKFKHNKLIIKASVWFSAFFVAGLGGLLFYLSREYCLVHVRSVSLYVNDNWEYTTFGLCLNLIGGLLWLVALLVLSAVSVIDSNEVLSIIKNEKNQNFEELINYLNSIHKLPNEVKNLIIQK
jgi:hypothetical protein